MWPTKGHGPSWSIPTGRRLSWSISTPMPQPTTPSRLRAVASRGRVLIKTDQNGLRQQSQPVLHHQPLPAWLRYLARGFRVHAGIVEGSGENRHRDRARPSAVGIRAGVVVALAAG